MAYCMVCDVVPYYMRCSVSYLIHVHNHSPTYNQLPAAVTVLLFGESLTISFMRSAMST